ncbi:hypothetical protein K440DRAFT_363809 [Wilcoxina mikolae CBS 423.85]|nr:hypothetical protein K440DRAFT_363809 [Wilcoxina mikolae CBS 423.85]
MPGHLISLPVELLDQIIQHLEKPELSLLRQTCWILRCAVAPKVFRRLEIDSTNELQLECLATAGTVSNLASVRHAKEVKVTLGRDGKALSDAMSTISALKAVEQVEFCFWAEGLSFVSLLTSLQWLTCLTVTVSSAPTPITGLTLL